MFYGLPITEPMHIHTLDGEKREATILEKVGDNKYIAEYNGVRCTAIFNVFVGSFYVDDKYGVLQDKSKDAVQERSKDISSPAGNVHHLKTEKQPQHKRRGEPER